MTLFLATRLRCVRLRRARAACAVGVLLAALTGPAPLAAAQNDDEAADQAIRARERAAAAAVLDGDPLRLRQIWAEDFIVTNPYGVVLTREEALAGVRAGRIRYNAFTRLVDRVRRIGEDLVISIGSEAVEGREGASVPAGVVQRRRFTHVWVRRDGEWRLLNRHASILTAQPVAQ